MNIRKSYLNWSWILFFLFFLLSITNLYFGIMALLCMLLPLYHSIKGNGKVNCSHYCPRGSFLGKFLKKISLNKTLPEFFKTNLFKNTLLISMMLILMYSIGKTGGNIYKIGFVFFRFVLVSSLISVFLGILYKPRSWCQVCPMGHLSGEIAKVKKNRTV